MNITALEKLARNTIKGESIDSNDMLSKGVITPAEHRSLRSLSWQIAANMQATNSGAAAIKVKNTVYWAWV